MADDEQTSDWTENGLTAFLIFGLFASYVPQVCLIRAVYAVVAQHCLQHLRIIRAGTSIGFSPWFLLLGSTSSAAAMLNMCVARALCACG